MSNFPPSGLPSKGGARTVTDHPPAPTLLPGQQPQREGESSHSSSHSHRSSRRNKGPPPKVLEENYRGDHGPVSVSGSSSSSHRSGSSRSSAQYPPHAKQQQPHQMERDRSLLQRIGDNVVQSFHGESNVVGRGGLAAIQREARPRHGLGPQLEKFGPHKGKPVRGLSEREREETREYKRREAKKLAGSWVHT